MLVVAACGDDANGGTTSSGGGDDASTGTGTGTGTGTEGSDPTFGGNPPCEHSSECADTMDAAMPYCVAPYDPGTSVRGESVCVQTCVAEDDLGRWCVDDAACCEGLRCNEVDGFCLPRSGGSSSTGADSTTDVTGTDGSGSSSGTGSSGTGGTGP